MVINCNKEGTG